MLEPLNGQLKGEEVETMSKNRRKSDRINIRIEPELKAQFEQYLEETGRTMSWLVTKWIREELERWRQKQGRK